MSPPGQTWLPIIDQGNPNGFAGFPVFAITQSIYYPEVSAEAGLRRLPA